MTDEQINLAIHKAVGFEWNDERKLWERHANKARVASHKPFYYSSDLNLMHEVEEVLVQNNNWRIGEYEARLFSSVGEMNNVSSWRGVRLCFHATARQRAEAFLRTLGKWEEA